MFIRVVGWKTDHKLTFFEEIIEGFLHSAPKSKSNRVYPPKGKNPKTLLFSIQMLFWCSVRPFWPTSRVSGWILIENSDFWVFLAKKGPQITKNRCFCLVFRKNLKTWILRADPQNGPFGLKLDQNAYQHHTYKIKWGFGMRFEKNNFRGVFLPKKGQKTGFFRDFWPKKPPKWPHFP